MNRGCGVDIVDVRRIAALIEKHGSQFLQKVFSPAEIDYCQRMAIPAIHFAGRWAAKEAFYKAIPSACQALATWHSIQVVPKIESRRPEIEIVSAELKTVLDNEGVSSFNLSISHEKEYCVAFVVVD
jgi:holo-[acyl-carrier protein] synthase